MKKDYTIGLIITLYNSKKYIKLLLKSLANQVEPFDEIIIVDHGSSDNSYQIAIDYSVKINLKIKHNKLKTNKGGPAWPRNIGIKLSNSDYICFNDPDDIPLLNRCYELKKEIAQSNSDIIVHTLQRYRERQDNLNVIKLGSKINNSFTKKNILNKIYFESLSTPVGSYVIRKKKIGEILFREEKEIIGGEDRVILLDLLRNNCSISHLNKVLLLYNNGSFDNKRRTQRNSLTSRKNTISINKYLLNNFSIDYKGKLSPRFIVSLYLCYIDLNRYDLLFEDIKKFGLMNNIKIIFTLLRILYNEVFNKIIFRSDYKNIKKYLFKNYKLKKNKF